MTQEGGPEVFSYEDVSIPEINKDQVLVKVSATSATPTELLWWPTWNNMDATPRINPIPAHEFAGIVERCGEDVTDFNSGDEVYGLNGWFQDGASAEFVVIEADVLAKKPKNCSFTEAATVPLSALTAWQALVRRGKVKNGETVLIHGAAGAVGSYAVQIAHHLGGKVIATTSKETSNYVKSLGADTVIDYRNEKFEDLISEVDFILDMVGEIVLTRSLTVLKEGGRIFSLATSSKENEYFFYVEPDRSELEAIGELIDEGVVKANVDSVFKLEDAAEAYRAKPRHGKIAIKIA